MARSVELAQSERDEQVLRFACLHGHVTELQVQVLLSSGRDAANRVLTRLVGRGLVRRQRVGTNGPVVFAATTAGSTQIDGEPLRPVPAAGLQHEVAVGWLWLAARQGRLGSGRVVTGRELAAADPGPGTRRYPNRPGSGSSIGSTPDELGFRIELADDTELHYPDLVLIEESGWAVVDLVLTASPANARGALLSSYAATERVRRVILAVRDPVLARAIILSPFVVGIRGRLEIYPVRMTEDLLVTADP